jgi:hypothetical protein
MKLSGNFTLLIGIVLLTTFSFKIQSQTLPKQSNTWFSTAGACLPCHDTHVTASRDKLGNDVSPVSSWRSTMLANASKDPFWQAKVKQEGIENPAHKSALENVCTRCHAPMGMINALLTTSVPYSMDNLKNDNMGKDGISCTLCHQINGFSSPLFSGNFDLNAAKEIYGPFTNPLINQMRMNTGFTPVLSPKINESRLCGSCHTLITNPVNEKDEFTGTTFVEQAIYQEWENSDFGKQKISCQSCHMPRIAESVIIASQPGFITGRQPFGLHNLTGGNQFMLKLLKDNHTELQLNSGTDLIQKSIDRTNNFLTTQTIDLTIGDIQKTQDSAFINVRMINKAGHKFPSGYPSRRAYLECIVTNGQDTVFHSGKAGAKALTNIDRTRFEPHYNLITREEQVQIYEFVMGNTSGQVTTILEKAYVPLKDNRIPPRGFASSHNNYDTVKIVGLATKDADYFNGLGQEIIRYGLPLSDLGDNSTVKVLLHYESIPEPWTAELFSKATSASEIELFRGMYLKSDRTAIEIASVSRQIITSSATFIQDEGFRIFPNPTTGSINVEGTGSFDKYFIYSSDGQCVRFGQINTAQFSMNLDLPSGTYYVVLQNPEKKRVEKIMLY